MYDTGETVGERCTSREKSSRAGMITWNSEMHNRSRPKTEQEPHPQVQQFYPTKLGVDDVFQQPAPGFLLTFTPGPRMIGHLCIWTLAEQALRTIVLDR